MMNHMEVSGDGISLMCLLLLCYPQGEPHFAEMALMSPHPQRMSTHKSVAWALCRLNANLVAQERQFRVWKNQTSFRFHTAPKCVTITAGLWPWKLNCI